MKILVGKTYFWERNENWWKMKSYLATFTVSRTFYMWFYLFIKLSCLGYWGIWTFRKKQAINCCCCFLTVPHVSRILVPQLGMNLCLIQWTLTVLTTESAGKSPFLKIIIILNFLRKDEGKILNIEKTKPKSFFFAVYRPARGIYTLISAVNTLWAS